MLTPKTSRGSVSSFASFGSPSRMLRAAVSVTSIVRERMNPTRMSPETSVAVTNPSTSMSRTALVPAASRTAGSTSRRSVYAIADSPAVPRGRVRPSSATMIESWATSPAFVAGAAVGSKWTGRARVPDVPNGRADHRGGLDGRLFAAGREPVLAVDRFSSTPRRRPGRAAEACLHRGGSGGRGRRSRSGRTH